MAAAEKSPPTESELAPTHREVDPSSPSHADFFAAATLVDQGEKREQTDQREPAPERKAAESPAESKVAESLGPEHPARVGRYEIRRLLGVGSFGRVYHAHDTQLNRAVALKVPNSQLFNQGLRVEEFLAEARTAAGLKHEGLVAVYDVQVEGQRPYIVQELIDGPSLGEWLKGHRPSREEAVRLVVDMAQAIGFAHRQGFVHRDLKPGNILLDSEGRAHVADFGLAIHESQQAVKGGEVSGTPAYMSPEQVRGETHRLDCRTDIWSLGVILHELLVGRRPFEGVRVSELFDQITTKDPPSLQQLDPSVPQELERICLKCLARRQGERYASAAGLVDDLLFWQTSQSQAALLAAVTKAAPHVVPKGMRSFDEHDADFFLELLSGPRDRDGLPEPLRFWKTRLEELDADQTFAVGLLYGPSGCGKSSLVKAGLLPRLSEHVRVVYIEATPDETEARLLRGLQQRFPSLAASSDLCETLQRLREEHTPIETASPPRQPACKVLLVIDQFEQWLHTHASEVSTPLAAALRHCDGGRVQCLLMVRDDFWLAVSRFMVQLEINLRGDHNTALVDLFDVDHAQKVLAAFGRAFGKLPEDAGGASQDQEEFLKQAVAGLAQDGKVISVRLALFAEMMKGKPWTPATLQAVGGARGIGFTFLEETFSSPAANPSHRRHQPAARAILDSLLPESGADIKGQMRSQTELLAVSGYAGRPQDFAELIRILDNELRLITPTDPEGKEGALDAPDRRTKSVSPTADAPTEVPLLDGSTSSHQPANAGRSPKRFYQLTHDYLVHSLRDWLTRKQKETRRGRAELRLAERASLWIARPENRHLPSLWEFLEWRLLTARRGWTVGQARMMDRALRVHGIRSGLVVLLLLIVALGGWQLTSRFQAASLVEQLASADLAQVPGIVKNLHAYRRWSIPLLTKEFQEAAEGSDRKLRAALALLPTDDSKAAYLRDRLLDVKPDQFAVVRDALKSHQQTVVEPLWTIVMDPQRDAPARFQAACALATYASGDERWQSTARFVVARLVTLESSELVAWRTALRPARANLLEPLAAIYRQPAEREQARTYAAETLADYAADEPRRLFDLLADAEPFQFGVIQARLAEHPQAAIELGAAESAKAPAEDASEDDKEHLARRQASAAAALLMLGAAERVWPLLKHSPDPRARSYFIHSRNLPANAGRVLVDRLDQEPDVTIRRALIFTLGESELLLPHSERPPLIQKLLSLFEHEPDAGLHSAAQWLLRKWGQEEQLRALIDKLRTNEEQLQARQATQRKQWYVNTQGQTLVILEPGEFLMGSPLSEPDRKINEIQHRRRLVRRFAISAHEVTLEQFAAFQRARPEIERLDLSQYVKTDDSPQVAMTWYEAAEYCNWLSEREGLSEDQWCYMPNAQKKYAAGMKARPRAGQLLGYRLPSEAEWEYACRASAVTSRPYGLSDSLLASCAWHQANAQGRVWPVGRLAPNDFGLFDIFGNVFEWCHDPVKAYPNDASGPVDDVFHESPLADDAGRVLRGGAYLDPPSNVRSAYRNADQPNNRNGVNGFRPARTFPY